MADLLDPAHSGTEDVVDVSLRVFQRLHRPRTDHAAVCDDTEPANVKPIPNPLDDGNQRGHIRCVARPHLTTDGFTRIVDDRPHNHLVEIRAVILAVSFLANRISP